MKCQRAARIMKALSNENRLELFLEIAKHEERQVEACGCFVSEAVRFLKLSAPTISHHLKELANAGLITTERRGKFVVARVNRDTVREVASLLGDVVPS